MDSGLVAALNCELGTAVQAAKAHRAVILDPDGTTVLHLDRMNRALARTQTAANTRIVHCEYIRKMIG